MAYTRWQIPNSAMLEPRQLPLEQEKSLPPRDVERVDALGTPVPGPSRWRHGAVGRWPTRISAAILAIFVLASVLAPLIAPYGYATVGFIPLAAPSAAHPFGTDDLGRDVLSRVIYGGRTTLEVTVIAVAIALVIGVTLGLVSAYFGKWLDILVMRIVDVVFAFPAILLAIGLVAVLGASVQNLVIVITALTIPRFVVVVRAAARKVRYSEYLEVAQFMNTGALRIILRHVVPNVASYIMVEAALSMSSAVLIEAALGFLGLGAPPPVPSWGGMVSEAMPTMTISWWTVVFPGLAIVLLVLSLNLLADGLEARFNIGRES